MPLVPDAPAFDVCNSRLPEVDDTPVALPLTSDISPPVLAANDEDPAVIAIDPPEPLSPEPTLT